MTQRDYDWWLTPEPEKKLPVPDEAFEAALREAATAGMTPEEAVAEVKRKLEGKGE